LAPSLSENGVESRGGFVKQDVARDEQVLAFRRKGRSFVKIAGLLGFDSAVQAVTAYRRAVRRRTPEEQATLRAAERRRFDARARAVRANSELAADEVAARLAKIERLRAALG
jgi:hypothetical protein